MIRIITPTNWIGVAHIRDTYILIDIYAYIHWGCHREVAPATWWGIRMVLTESRRARERGNREREKGGKGSCETHQAVRKVLREVLNVRRTPPTGAFGATPAQNPSKLGKSSGAKRKRQYSGA